MQAYWCAISGIEVIRFLKYLLQQRHGALILVWDKHPIHKRKLVTQFLLRHSRLETYCFPTCAPEMNPMEFVWTQVSEATAGTAPRNVSELQTNVRRGIARTRKSQKRLRACLATSELPWQEKRQVLGHYLIRNQ